LQFAFAIISSVVAFYMAINLLDDRPR